MIKKSFGTILICFLVVFTFIMSTARQEENYPEYEKHVWQNTLPYRLLRPAALETGKKYPLVVFLHGAGERGNDNGIQLKFIAPLFIDKKNRQTYPCYFIAPQCPVNQGWANLKADRTLRPEPSRTHTLVKGLIDHLHKTLPIDTMRIYITGLSMGGYGTWDFIARYPSKFAAAAPICGGGDVGTAQKIKHIPLWAFHGAKDNTVPVEESRKMIEALKKAGGNPSYTEYPEVSHDSWKNAFAEPDFLPWLFRQSRKN